MSYVETGTTRHRSEADEERARLAQLRARLDEATSTKERVDRLNDLVEYGRTLPLAPPE
jgi:hypothetical protein